MVSLNVKRLIEAVRNTPVFEFPDMDAGTEYLYNIYRRMSQGENVSLSEINFAAFKLDDIDGIRKLESNFFRHIEDLAEEITNSLKNLPPVTAAISFI